MKIYIAGPITNNPGYEKQFAEAEEKLLSMGHEVERLHLIGRMDRWTLR